MSSLIDSVKVFSDALLRHFRSKERLYSNEAKKRPASFWLAQCVEELGEIASALNRERDYNAVTECVDLAHCAMMLALSIDQGESILLNLDKQE